MKMNESNELLDYGNAVLVGLSTIRYDTMMRI